ncbi:MAG TPA: 2-isopropylmalate synthase, partial [Gammaproteobacteria bacterium]|nr:2-isopropylmalate synthase [Gammaproteobacteria bacterium]
GEQSPGASMTRDEKVRIARALEKMRVDVIEAGFPAASPGDFDAVRAVCDAVDNSIICGLSRANLTDIDRAGEALSTAKRGRIHTFIATSPIHMDMKLQMSPDEVVEQAVRAVAHACQYTDDVEFSAEDAGRSDPDFLCRIFEAVIDAGATTINVPDTVGYTMPRQFADLIATIMQRVPNMGKAVMSVHCHNDLGVAVANSLAAVGAGARQVECTINGLGERAGNASLEEIVMAIETRKDFFDVTTGIDTTQIVPTSRLVSNISGFPVQPNKAIVGANAFAHEAGIHQDGILKARETYEIMRAEDVGWSKNSLVLGKHSGRNAFRTRMEELGISFDTEDALNKAFARFKDLADKKHEIFDDDLQAIASDADLEASNEIYHLISLNAGTASGEEPVATLTLSINGEEITETSTGSGVVDAAFSVIKKITGSTARLTLYSVNAITSGTDAQGEVTTRLEKDGRIVNGQGSDTDIVIASAKSYINALNRMGMEVRTHPQMSGV